MFFGGVPDTADMATISAQEQDSQLSTGDSIFLLKGSFLMAAKLECHLSAMVPFPRIANEEDILCTQSVQEEMHFTEPDPDIYKQVV